MPTGYLTQGFVHLEGVTYTGTQGEAGSTLSWTGVFGNDPDFQIFDQDVDNKLDAYSDYYLTNAATFTGYTITSGGVEYGVFRYVNGDYYVPVPVDGTGQAIIPASGTSNAFQAETNASVYLCFAAGTAIATPEGERAVEDLQIGDLLRCADGREVPVRWLGRQTLVKAFAGPRAQLVRIAAGALGNHSDLYVTGDHGMVLGECVINASALVNGDSIAWVPLAQTPARQTVYHIETEAHDVILANGAPSETFIDYAGRRAFDNWAEYEALYGTAQTIAESPMPRISSARLVPDHLRAVAWQGARRAG